MGSDTLEAWLAAQALDLHEAVQEVAPNLAPMTSASPRVRSHTSSAKRKRL